jgi:hypothetical protein
MVSTKRSNWVGLLGLVMLTQAMAGVVLGQQCPLPRPGQVCFYQVQHCVDGHCVLAPAPMPAPKQLSTPEGIELVLTAKVEADGPHCRCIVSGSCGSGTICGADADGAYVLSNAHVWGTQIGKSVNVDLVSGGQTKRVVGKLVFAGYSSSRMVDFAIAYVEGLSSKRYMPLLKTEPDSPPYGTTGSPRCVWPLVTKDFSDPRNYGQGLITGMPNAIGGQSGSAIYNSQGRQIALLTWSINGRCAGQKTSKLWEVASQRDVSLADERPKDLQELADDGGCRPATEEGVFGSCKLFETADDGGPDQGLAVVGPRIRPLTENVIASNVNAAMDEMPIWYTPGGGGDGGGNLPPDPDCPDCPDCPKPDPDCVKLTDKEKELIDFLRRQQEEAGSFADFLKSIDYVKLFKTIMEIISLINSGK